MINLLLQLLIHTLYYKDIKLYKAKQLHQRSIIFINIYNTWEFDINANGSTEQECARR